MGNILRGVELEGEHTGPIAVKQKSKEPFAFDGCSAMTSR